MKLSYPQFFEAATSNQPYDWQCRLAEDSTCQSRLIDIPTGLGKTAGVVLAWLWNYLRSQSVTSNDTAPQNAPPWPRRLVYCLPMRTLVEQTESEVTKWLFRLALSATQERSPERDAVNVVLGKQKQSIRDSIHENNWKPEGFPSATLSADALKNLLWLVGVETKNSSFTPHPSSFSPVVLMGGEDIDPAKRDWDLYPERPAILIGTQDMLLSRALNRGYGMSRYRWPMHFGLLNNDCLWVMDEVQLMGAGLATTTQLEGFHNQVSFGARKTFSWWMSATIRPDWLKTVDFPERHSRKELLRLLDSEKSHGRVLSLRQAPKNLKAANDPNGPVASGKNNLKAVANFICNSRSSTGLKLVVVNTVARARDLHSEIAKLLKNEAKEPILLHSQFRVEDREEILAEIMRAEAGNIVISTQVIEAGVDLSAHTLFTELAPWSSLVQRFGRCNRHLLPDGSPHYPDAQIFWFDLPDEKDHPPYETSALNEARQRLNDLNSAAIQHLENINAPDADRPQFRHVIRRKDLVELFDTTPDLAGADLDIDRFIRDSDESHVRVFWRAWQTPNPNGNDDHEAEAAPHRNELCPVAIGDFKKLISKTLAWRWNGLDKEWQSVRSHEVYPGQTYLLHSDAGGYQRKLGWTGVPKPPVAPMIPPSLQERIPEEANDDDPESETKWQSIEEHTNRVCSEMERLLSALEPELIQSPSTAPLDFPAILRHAARWHDWGKAHEAFQAKFKPEALQKAIDDGLIADFAAKAPGERGNNAWRHNHLPKHPREKDRRRPHFRHELASALGVLQQASGFPLIDATAEHLARDLAAYLIAAHHGKVRLSLRSLPEEWVPPVNPQDPREPRFARGVWDGDIMPSVQLGNDTLAQPVTLSLEPMELGLCEEPPFTNQPSWAERALALRDTLGPFRLAFLETLLRSADARGSRMHEQAASIVRDGQSPFGSTPPLSPEQQALIDEVVEDGLSIQDRFRPEPRYKQTGKGHYESRTVEDIQGTRKNADDEPER